MILHVLLLYMPLVALLFLAPRYRGDPKQPLREVLYTLLPFGVLALLESLQLRATGHMIAEWALPLLVALLISATCHGKFVWICRCILVMLSLLLLLDGGYLLMSGYSMSGQTDWYTPFTGMRHR